MSDAARPEPLAGTFRPEILSGNPNDPRYHPNLGKAAEEIRAIVKKYDLAANIGLQGPTTTTYVRVIDPSWSCAFFEQVSDGKVAIRFRTNPEDGEAQKQVVDETTAMLIGFCRQAIRDKTAMEVVLAMLSQHFKITSMDAPLDCKQGKHAQS